MIIMAADYVGYCIVNFLCGRQENIDIFVYDTADRGGYNEQMIRAVSEASPAAEIYSNQELGNAELLCNIRERKIDFGILAWWPHIIPNSVIQLTRRGFVNTHPAYLPYNRGKHPSFWSLVEETPFGVTLHYVNQGIDSGPIIARKEIPIAWLDTGESLAERAKEEILNLFYDNYEAVKNGTLDSFPQMPSEGSFHYGKELELSSVINLDQEYTARTLLNMIRGRMFNGQGAANFTDGTEKYYVSVSIRPAHGD